MKYFWTMLAGFLVGATVALTGLYFNPLMETIGPLPGNDDSRFTYASPLTSELVFTHGNRSRVPT